MADVLLIHEQSTSFQGCVEMVSKNSLTELYHRRTHWCRVAWSGAQTRFWCMGTVFFVTREHGREKQPIEKGKTKLSQALHKSPRSSPTSLTLERENHRLEGEACSLSTSRFVTIL